MERNITTQAIVLQTRRWGDLHRRVTLLSPDFGLINVLIYGARKGKHTGKCTQFLFGEFFLYHNPVRGEYSFSDVRPIRTHESLRASLETSAIASLMAELVIKTNGGDYKELFFLLDEALEALDCKPELAAVILIQFIWKLITLSGVAADLEQCPMCERTYNSQEVLGFSRQLVTPCCLSCAESSDEMILPPGARRYLQYTASLTFFEAIEVELSKAACSRIRQYMIRYVALFCGTRLYTLESGILECK